MSDYAFPLALVAVVAVMIAIVVGFSLAEGTLSLPQLLGAGGLLIVTITGVVAAMRGSR